MRSIDFAPLMRATVGFDRMMDLLDSASRLDEAGNGYPPYNIEKLGEDTYRITMAVVGFGEDDLDVTVIENRLVIRGQRQNGEEPEQHNFLHRGIATRAFERRFELADHIQVTGAQVENGQLHVDLVREIPESKKPRTIKIAGAAPGKTKVIEEKAA